MGRRAKTAVVLAGSAAILLTGALPALSGPVALPRDPVTCLNTGVVKIRPAGQYSHLVDRVEVGYRAADETIRVHYAGASKDEGPYEVTEDCTIAGVDWRRIDASMDKGGDTVRLDAKGLPAEFEAVPASIEARLNGEDTPDVLYGHAGRDELRGGEGADGLYGYEGEDLLVGGNKTDRMLAGSGDDVVNAADGAKKPDKVLCGKGDDKAIVDPADEPSGCEKVRRR